MKKLFSIGVLLCSIITATGQVKIGNNPSIINGDAILELEHTTKGMLLPRLALTSTIAAAPLAAHTAGMIVYNTATTGDVTPGYYFNNGTVWLRITANVGTEPWYAQTTGTGATSNIENIYHNGKVGIGLTTVPTQRLEVIGNIKGDRFLGYGAGGNSFNSAVGLDALLNNTTGFANEANGYFALTSNTMGYGNTANGANALRSNTIGYLNTANGVSALNNNTAGNNNTANGLNALFFNSTGSANTANGYSALYNNTGDSNTATGATALSSNTTGDYNTANGYASLYFNTIGIRNTADGFQALNNNTAGSRNTANGYASLFANTIGITNTALGDSSGYSITTGSNNTAIGFSAQVPTGTVSNQVRIGNTDVIYAGVQVAWTITSDKRWKEDVQTLPFGLDMVNKLRPVDYVRKNADKNSFNVGTREIGLIAQEVDETLKNMGYTQSGIISKDDNGYYGIRYNDFIPVLIKAVQEQQAQIEALKLEIKALKK